MRSAMRGSGSRALVLSRRQACCWKARHQAAGSSADCRRAGALVDAGALWRQTGQRAGEAHAGSGLRIRPARRAAQCEAPPASAAAALLSRGSSGFCATLGRLGAQPDAAPVADQQHSDAGQRQPVGSAPSPGSRGARESETEGPGSPATVNMRMGTDDASRACGLDVPPAEAQLRQLQAPAGCGHQGVDLDALADQGVAVGRDACRSWSARDRRGSHPSAAPPATAIDHRWRPAPPAPGSGSPAGRGPCLGLVQFGVDLQALQRQPGPHRGHGGSHVQPQRLLRATASKGTPPASVPVTSQRTDR
jgi:hypothetical protein